MEHFFERTQLLLGEKALAKLQHSHVCIFGIGGVGSFATEALARSNVGTLTLVDGDVICPTNINRQIHATTSTINMPKVDVMKKRILQINPQAKVITIQEFYTEHTASDLFFNCDYIIDAVDDIKAKTSIAVKAYQKNVPLISAMGAANKLDPTKFEVADIYTTAIDPLARIMRKNMRAAGIPKLKVVYSKEKPLQPQTKSDTTIGNDATLLGSVSFVPSVMGLIIAGEVVKELSSA